MAIALAARRPLARANDPVHTRYFAATALWSGAVFAPTGLVLYAQYPDWMLLYLANPAHLPGLLMFPLILLIYGGVPLVGFLITQHFLRTGKRRWVRLSVLLAVVALVAVPFLARGRLMNVAYYDAFHAGVDLVSVFRSPLLLALFPCSVAIVGILAFIVITSKKHADLMEHLPKDRTAAAYGLAGNTASMPKVADVGPGNLPRPPQGATPGH